MFFSRATLRPDAVHRDQYWRLTDNGYLGHQLAWALFSDQYERERDFIYRWETDGPTPLLYTVSQRKPVDREGLFQIKTKPYEPSLNVGQPLAFSLRANAVVKRRDENDRQQVHDVVMDLKHQLRESDEWDDGDVSQAELVQRAGVAWLESRAEQYGFHLADGMVRAESYRKHQFKKPRNRRKVTFVTIDFQGRFEVADVERFRRALYEGVGPTKAYGCGLLMVRPL
jgi:CRISPR system Cascade subunit CasE